MLLFQKKFIEQIKRGEKTQTIRLWKHCRMKPGQRSYIPGIGYIAVTNVERVELDQLTDADALLDGFQTADALRAELCTLYDADILAQRKAFKIKFAVCSESEQERIKEEREMKREIEKNKRRLFQHFDFT